QTGPPRWTFYSEGGTLTFDRNRFATAWPNVYAWGHTPTSPVVNCPNLARAAGTCVVDSVTSFQPLADPATSPIGTGYRTSEGAQVSGGDRVRYFISGGYEREVSPLSMPGDDRAIAESIRGGPLSADEYR